MPVESIDEPVDVDTTDVLREVNGAHGSTYALMRSLIGGVQSGAWLLRDDKGTTAVLKWSPNKSWSGQIQRAERAVATARQHGYPTPAWLAVGITSSGYGYQVQEYVTGRPLDQLTEKAARSLVQVLELQTDLDPDPARSWSSYVTDSLRELPSTMAAVTATGAGGELLVGECVQLLGQYEFPVLPSADLVHGDFRPSNIVFDGDQVSGVIDIEALGSGSRVFDYATLLDHEAADDAAVELLVDAGSQVTGPAALAHCLVHVDLDLALFMQRRLGVDSAELTRRSRALGARVELVSRLLTRSR